MIIQKWMQRIIKKNLLMLKDLLEPEGVKLIYTWL